MPNLIDPAELRSIQDTIKLLKISRVTFYNWLNANKIKTIVISGKHFISQSEIERLMQEGYDFAKTEADAALAKLREAMPSEEELDTLSTGLDLYYKGSSSDYPIHRNKQAIEAKLAALRVLGDAK
jgi:hypothetical protein